MESSIAKYWFCGRRHRYLDSYLWLEVRRVLSVIPGIYSLVPTLAAQIEPLFFSYVDNVIDWHCDGTVYVPNLTETCDISQFLDPL